MALKVKMKGNIIKVDLPLLEMPKVSGSGKSIVIASTKGPKNASVEYEGQDVYLVANAFVKNPKYDSAQTSQTANKRAPSREARKRERRRA